MVSLEPAVGGRAGTPGGSRLWDGGGGQRPEARSPGLTWRKGVSNKQPLLQGPQTRRPQLAFLVDLERLGKVDHDD